MMNIKDMNNTMRTGINREAKIRIEFPESQLSNRIMEDDENM